MNQSGSEQRKVTDVPRTENPRRVRHGIKLRHRDGPVADNFIAQRWLALLESVFSQDVRSDGFDYAKAGQTASLDVTIGEIRARVQGRDPRPYALSMRLTPMTDEQWSAAIDQMAGGAIYVARLIAGDMPASVAEVFESLGVELVPSDAGALQVTCTCSEPDPCKHAAAAAYVLMERFNDDPLLVFTLYGMAVGNVLDQLRQARAIHTHGIASAHADPLIPESQIDPQPLEASVEAFWRSGPELAELEKAPPPQHIAHALLRRLGPSPMQGRFPLVGLLASVYDTVAQDAIHIRDRAEHIEPDER